MECVFKVSHVLRGLCKCQAKFGDNPNINEGTVSVVLSIIYRSMQTSILLLLNERDVWLPGLKKIGSRRFYRVMLPHSIIQSGSTV